MDKNKNIIIEAWDFLRVRKKWWLLPILIMTVLVGSLIILTTASPISPLIYIIL